MMIAVAVLPTRTIGAVACIPTHPAISEPASVSLPRQSPWLSGQEPVRRGARRPPALPIHRFSSGCKPRRRRRSLRRLPFVSARRDASPTSDQLDNTYNSDSALNNNMPVGFENSALKMSFSLSSLQPSSESLESPEQARLKSERPYHSLTKKPRRDPEQESWRRSWDGRDGNKDDFWAALQTNYNFIMDNNLIDSCKEASGELSWDEQDVAASYSWSFNEFLSQFSELYSWLDSVQEAVYGKEENVIDRNLRASHTEEMQRKSYRLKLFNDQSNKLLRRYPDMKDEVSWRVTHLNSKWEMLEQAISPCKSNPDQTDMSTDVEHEVRCLRKWIREMEARLKPLNLRAGHEWGLAELEEKAQEHKVLQRDIESHGRIVNSVVRLSERLGGQTLRVARSLERRWHHLYLRSLEWQCHVESLAARLRNPSPSGAYSDSDEEPVSKHPRLSAGSDASDGRPSDASDHHTDDGSYFEDGLEDLCVMEECADSNMVVSNNVSTHCVSVPVEDNSFNKSIRKADNYAIFYFKHRDTDSEQEISGARESTAQVCTAEESSEDEWTFTPGQEHHKSGCISSGSSSETMSSVRNRKSSVVVKLDFNSPSVNSNIVNNNYQSDSDKEQKSPSRESINRLVNQAEELVREDRKHDKSKGQRRNMRVFDSLAFGEEGRKLKGARVKEWINVHLQSESLQQPMDSCDASGEYSDEDKESECSDELNSSVLTCHQLVPTDTDSTPVAERSPLLPSENLPKVVMRKRRTTSSQRPWSVSGVPNTSPTQPLAQFSISESALHQMLTSPKGRTLSNTVHSNLSSSTISEIIHHGNEGSGSQTSSLRRRKVRLRKRALGRKSESGSDGVTVGSSDCMSPQKNGRSRSVTDGSSHTLVKSGSFSGTGSSANRSSSTSERCTNSDPAMLQSRTGDSTSDTGTETEEERRARKSVVPSFRLGPNEGAVTMVMQPIPDSDADRSLGQGEEQLSSHSEVAWDNYQEKYNSEPYSEELADSEAARRLLEFGDDYRNFLDSQSDGASSLSTNQMPNLVRRRKPIVGGNDMLDSDSDLEEVRDLICKSQSQLEFSEQFFSKKIAKASSEVLFMASFAEITATCRENLNCLQVLLDNVENVGGLLSSRECKEIQRLVERWDSLHTRAEELQRVASIQREMAALRDELVALSNRVAASENELANRDHLEGSIQRISGEVQLLRAHKTRLLQLNVAVHRVHTDTGLPAHALKDQVAELYRLWDDTHIQVSQQLGKLQRVRSAWEEFSTQLSELQGALRTDEATLRMLDAALQRGEAAPDVASSVRDVARLLSEKQDSLCSQTLSSEGSLSDSGISDSGSEQELSERERRLSALRRLVRQLEGVLAPGNAALATMAGLLEQAEAELRTLQRACRELIVRTAVTVAHSPQHAKANGTASVEALAKEAATAPGTGGKRRRPWLWRVMRTALPFQMALVALLCVAYLLEPNCCEAINNLSLSLAPKLRYVSGPPPV